MLLGLNEGEGLNFVIDFLPGRLGVDPELELPAVLELDLHFVDNLVGGVLGELVDFAQGEEQGLVVLHIQADLIVGYDELGLLVLAVGQLAEHELGVMQHCDLPLLDLIFPQA